MNKTFSIGGAHIPDNKISAIAAIEDFPLVEYLYIPVSQHIGAPAEPIVAKGDIVKAGQLIAKANGFISANIHSPASGTVTSIEMRSNVSGFPRTHIVIKTEGDEWEESIDRTSDIVREINLTAEEIVKRVAYCGVVGLGGAAFPTSVKLSPPPDKRAEYLIVNGAECEPFLTSDYRIMVEYPEKMLIGTKIMMRALGVKKAYIGVEVNKPDAIEILREFTKRDYSDIEVVPLKKRYPQGGEKQLIDAILKRRVPYMGLPVEVGTVVQNVGTALAVYEAVQKNKPLIDRIITVTGNSLSRQYNFKMRIGTPLDKVIEFMGGLPEDIAKIVCGGPMMGEATAKLGSVSLKSSSGYLFLTEKETKRSPEGSCIRCAKCVNVCAMGLEPYLFNSLSRVKRYEELEHNSVQECIECGCCVYMCPASIPLLDTIRPAKAEVLKRIRGRLKS